MTASQPDRPAVRLFGTPHAGPVVTIFGGIHGDELEGVLASATLCHMLEDELVMGQVRIVSVANPRAFAAGSRLTPPSGDNLARVFPGDAQGTYAERVANDLVERVLKGSDMLIDLHSAGRDYEMPLFVGYDASAPSADRAGALAASFGAPIVWAHPRIGPGRSLSAAAGLGIPAIYVEGGGGGQVRGHDFDAYVQGVRNVLGELRILEPSGRTSSAPRILDQDDGDTDSMVTSTHDGYCISRVVPGQVVEEGQVLAEIRDLSGEVVQRIRADRRGVTIMLRRSARLSAGDGVAMLAGVGDR